MGYVQSSYYLEATASFLLVWLESQLAWLWVST